MDYNELQDFIKTVAKSGATEVSIETDDMKITIKAPPKGKAQAETIVQQVIPAGAASVIAQPQVVAPPPPAPAAAPAPVAEEAKAKDDDTSKYIEIKSPMVGTFYRKPGPDKPTFVNVGDVITEGQVICILEAMKLFNEIEAEPEMLGTVVKVLVDDGTPVEFDQVLFLVDPS